MTVTRVGNDPPTFSVKKAGRAVSEAAAAAATLRAFPRTSFEQWVFRKKDHSTEAAFEGDPAALEP